MLKAVSVALAWLLLASSASAHATALKPRAQIMIVGAAHLVSRHDVHNAAFEDSPMSPRRQKEIRDVIDHLARFHPTKVLIEAAMADGRYAERYRMYRAGQYSLGENEIYQFGFKLALASADSTIYPVDTDGPTLIESNTRSGKRISAFLQKNFLKVDSPEFTAFLARQDTLEKNGTYLDLLRYLNSDSAIRANAGWYSVMDGMGRQSDNAGSAYVSQWYARNCYIFSNILSVIQPGDRVVVFMGQGHEYLLREFARLNPHLESIDVLPFLQ